MTARRLARFGSRATERRWPSLIVSLAVSVGLFIAAFASMTSLPRWVRRDQRAVPELPVLVQIPTLPARRTPVAQKTTRAPNRAANHPIVHMCHRTTEWLPSRRHRLTRASRRRLSRRRPPGTAVELDRVPRAKDRSRRRTPSAQSKARQSRRPVSPTTTGPRTLLRFAIRSHTE
jgi:hypothetical protein